MENLHFDVLICAKGFKFVKIGVFTFEKNIFIISECSNNEKEGKKRRKICQSIREKV